MDNAREVIGRIFLQMGLDPTPALLELNEAEKKIKGRVTAIAKTMLEGIDKSSGAMSKLTGITKEEQALLEKLLLHYQKLGVTGKAALDNIAKGTKDVNNIIEQTTAQAIKAEQRARQAIEKTAEAKRKAYAEEQRLLGQQAFAQEQAIAKARAAEIKAINDVAKARAQAFNQKYNGVRDEGPAQNRRSYGYAEMYSGLLKDPVAERNAKYEKMAAPFLEQRQNEYASMWKAAEQTRNDDLKRAASARKKLEEEEAAQKRRDAADYVRWWTTALNERDGAQKKVAASQHSEEMAARTRRIAMFNEDMQRMRAAAEAEKERAQNLQRMVRNMRASGHDLQSIGYGLTFGVTAPIVGGAVKTLDMAGDLEISRRSLARFTGSMQRANQIIAGTRQLVLDAGNALKFEDALEGIRRLEVLKVTTRDSVSTMRILANTIAATGGSHDSLMRIVKALDDVRNKGRLSAEEVRQFVNANINVFEILEKQLGKTRAELTQMMKDGELDAKTVIEAILTGLDKKFGGELENRANTFKGMLARMKNELKFAFTDFGEANLPIAKAMLTDLRFAADTAATLARRFAELPEPVRQTALIMGALTAAGGPLTVFSGHLILTAAAVLDIAARFGKVELAIKAVTGAAGLLRAIPWGAMGAIGVGAGAIYGGSQWLFGDRMGEAEKRQKESQAGQLRRLGANVSPYHASKPGEFMRPLGADLTSYVQTLPTQFKGPNAPKAPPTQEELDKAASARAATFSMLGLTDHTTRIRDMEQSIRSLAATKDSVYALAAAFEQYRQVLDEALIAGAVTDGQYADKLASARGVTGVEEDRRTYRQFKLPNGAADNPANRAAWVAESRKKAAALEAERKKQLAGMFYSGPMPDIKSNSATAFASTLEGGALPGTKSGFNARDFRIAARAVEEYDRALKSLGVSNTSMDLAGLRQQLALVEEGFAEGMVSQRDLYKAQYGYYKAMMESGEKLTAQQEKHFRALDKTVNSVNYLKSAWRGMERQISTIMTDFGRNIVDILIPRNSVAQRAHDLSGEVTAAFRKAFEGLVSSGYADPAATLDRVIDSIKGASSISKANSIAVKHFGDIGPVIAKGLREGTISAKDLSAALKEAVNVLHNTDESEKRVNKLNALFKELGRSIARALVEEAGTAVAKFAGKHLKDLINSMDGVIQRIPIIGRGLASIWGNTAGGSGGVPNIPIGNGPIPGGGGGSIPTVPTGGWPGPPGGGKTGGAGGAGSAAAGGALGWVGAIGSVATAVSSIIGNFQTAGMNKSLDLIEHEVRYSQIHLLHLLNNANEFWPYLQHVHDRLIELNAIRDPIMAWAGGGGTVNIYFDARLLEASPAVAATSRALVAELRRANIYPKG